MYKLGLAALLILPACQSARADATGSGDCSTGLFSRLGAAYAEDANPAPADPNAAAPARRAMESPFSSPPFPSAEWQLGGVAYPIGVPNLNSQYPLEKALGCTAFGHWMQDNRVEIYGWINPSANISTSSDKAAMACRAASRSETTRYRPRAEPGTAAVTFLPKITEQADPGGVN